MFKTILFAVDQSREAHEAAVIVTNLVKTFGCSLYVSGGCGTNCRGERA